MSDDNFPKTTWETFPIHFNFVDKWPVDATTISTLAFSAIGYNAKTPQKRSDATETVIDDADGTVASAMVGVVVVKAGSDKNNYNIRCQATLNEGSKIEHTIEMRVRDD